MLAVAVEALHHGFLYAVLGVVIFTTISATTLKVAVFTSMPETMAVEALILRTVFPASGVLASGGPKQ